MSIENPIYDLVLLLDTRADDERRGAIVAQVEKMISDAGELIGRHDWGSRTLAFPIVKESRAEYYLFQFHGSAELLAKLDHQLKITDDVLRFRTIKLKRGTPAAPNVAPPTPALTANSEAAEPS